MNGYKPSELTTQSRTTAGFGAAFSGSYLKPLIYDLHLENSQGNDIWWGVDVRGIGPHFIEAYAEMVRDREMDFGNDGKLYLTEEACRKVEETIKRNAWQPNAAQIS